MPLFLVIILVVFFLLSPKPAYANIVGIDPSFSEAIGWILALILFNPVSVGFVNAVIESLVARRLFRKDISKRPKLFESFLIVNLITVFPTFIIYSWLVVVFVIKTKFFLDYPFLHPAAFLVELFPIVAEYFLYKWRFNDLSPKKLLLLAVGANTTSFLFGIILQLFLELIF